MPIETEDFPVPVNPSGRRLESIDLVRGLLMLLMAIDHARDYFSAVANRVDMIDPMHSWPALFATRWVTHLCAPGFIALAGVSVYLQRQRGKTAAEMARLLVTRGLWLMFLEVTVISFGWSFSLAPVLQVIWAVGVAMIFLGVLQWLPVRWIGGIGAGIVVLHNLLDPVRASRFGGGALAWDLLHQQGPIIVHHRMMGLVAYPIVPWIGVICLGYAFGPVAASVPDRRQRLAALLGASFLAVFAVLRVTHGYGDHFRFEHLGTAAETGMSFLRVEKYPPSLQYLLATIGIVLLIYAAFDRLCERGWMRGVRGVVETYGRVPFFYYVLHIYLLHAAALVTVAALGMNWRYWTLPAAAFYMHLDGWGYSLPVVYAVWLAVVAILYLPCRWFGGVKARRRDWWLSYL